MTDFFNFPKATKVCDTHGDFEAMQFPGNNWSKCPECQKEVDRVEVEQREIERRREAEEYRRKELLARSKIPPRFVEKTLDNFVAHTDGAKKALAVSVAYADEFAQKMEDGTSLIFCGGVGTGKTHLAIGIARRVLDTGMPALFTSVMNAIRTVKETYNRDHDESEREALDRFINVPLLILDEVGAQFGSDTEKLILFEIINGRYERLRPTIVISNLAKDALGEFLGERVLDRLRENGGRLIAFDWASYRRNAA